MSFLKKLTADSLLLWGYIVLAFSLFFFCLPVKGSPDGEVGTLVFIGCMIGAVCYCAAVKFSPDTENPRRNDYKLINLLQFLVSCYALNRVMEVFSATPPWLCVLLLLAGGAIIATVHFERLPAWLQPFVLFILGIALLHFVYQAIFLLPLYIISVPAILFFGVSVHTFIPAILVFHLLRKVAKISAAAPGRWLPFGAGVGFALAVCAVHIISWDGRVRSLNEAYSRALVEGSDQLPVWVSMAQTTRTDWMNERIIKNGLVYDTHLWHDNWFFSTPERSFGEQNYHDPLIVLSALFAPPLRLPEADRTQLLVSQFDARHDAEERLWRDDHLQTEDVQTQVRLWPQYRIAYTEQVITVANTNRYQWGNPEEAVYTFHVPAGSVVTSLSLWIDGKEAKGVLTSRAKATTAYRTIVGVQRRDPSVVHWQEGNRITVRVYPVARNDRRIFKIGITSPLVHEGDRLVYHNTWMEGPDASKATEHVVIKSDGGSVDPDGRQVSFRSSPLESEYKGSWRKNWSYTTDLVSLSQSGFGWGGAQYKLEVLKRAPVPVDIQSIYADVDAGWTEEEWNTLRRIAGQRPVWVDVDGLVAVRDVNQRQLFKELRQRRFGIFPVFLVRDPEHSVLISKGEGLSPNLSDLKGSAFSEQLKKFSENGRPLLLYHFGSQLTQFQQGLADLRLVRYVAGSLAALEKDLAGRSFALPSETDSVVALAQSGLQIVKAAGTGTPGAPDHLMRLFAFNHVLRGFGTVATDEDSTHAALVREAEEANIVTPVSSLVVLETAADYERFNIDQSAKGLQNATLKGSGAVPEPHEWVLIILSVALALFLFLRSRGVL